MGVNDVNSVFASEPCFNEFRSSYDEVLGLLNPYSVGDSATDNRSLGSYWIQQRDLANYSWAGSSIYFPALFVDLSTVNSPFKSNLEDNFFVNMSWSVQKKNLVNKTFATRLSNR